MMKKMMQVGKTSISLIFHHSAIFCIMFSQACSLRNHLNNQNTNVVNQICQFCMKVASRCFFKQIYKLSFLCHNCVKTCLLCHVHIVKHHKRVVIGLVEVILVKMLSLLASQQCQNTYIFHIMFLIHGVSISNETKTVLLCHNFFFPTKLCQTCIVLPLQLLHFRIGIVACLLLSGY